VKPANVLVAADELGEHAYLTDFGLTKRLDAADGLTTPGRFIGTIDYMSPEQIRGGQLGPASDVYSLGCLFYYLVVGQPPFALASDADVIAAHLEAQPPRLPGDLEPLDQVLLRAMAKDPNERFDSAGAFAHAAAAVVTELHMGATATRPLAGTAAHAPATASATEAGMPPDA
jgi:serine/threonine protein kinase